MANKKNLRLW